MLVLDVEEVYDHCAKSFARSKVWHPQTWDPFAATDVGSTRVGGGARGEPADVVRGAHVLTRARV
ncbi:hypothetical protein [Lapillicoccus jejuensis]|uniref:hypothetical protein n=1 Tax=Lapillicoccus jejuensis TaxID=402171 RepID=UPI00114D5DB1|nr:hypothetical protein [Lapillicoccus jejuensis]